MAGGHTGAPPTTRERVREVFRSGGFRRFFTARAISQLGDGMFQMAAADVLLFGDDVTDPALRLLALTAVTLIPFSVVGPLAGVFIDRWERRKILVRAPLARAAVAALAPAAAAAWGTGSPAFYAAVLFVLSANRFFLATMGAVLPQLVPEDDLIVANSISSTGGSIANVTGLGIGSALAATAGGTAAALASAVAFLAAGVAARAVRVHRGFTPERAPLWDEIVEVVVEMREGARRVRRARRVVFALTAVGAMQLLVGAMTTVIVVYYVAELDLGVGAATGLLGLLAVGIGLGIVAVPAVARRIRHDRLIPASFLIAAAGAGFAAGGFSRPRVVAGACVVGISYAFVKIPVDTIVQEEMADEVRGRAFAIYDMLFNMARAGGVTIAAVAFENGAASASVTGWVAAAYLAGGASFAFWERSLEMRKRRNRHAAAPPAHDASAGLLVPGEIVTVRAYAGARADEEPRAIVVGGVELPIDEVAWRAVVEDERGRRRIFVVEVAGRPVRLAVTDDGWEIERVR